MLKRGGVVVLLLILSACNPQRFFFYPNRVLYNDPDRFGIRHEIVQYPTLNGKKLYGLYFPAQGAQRGAIVHFHGNYGNISNHFPLAIFLTQHGYDVLSFDYEGYGASEGQPKVKHLIEDGIASVRYMHARSTSVPIAIFGQSLGGAVGVVVAAEEPLVKAVVIEAAFTSYRDIARVALRRSAWTWIFSPWAPLFLSRKIDPVRRIADIAPRPVFLLHGDQDRIVPLEMSQKLYAAAREPKQLQILAGIGHLNGRRRLGAAYEKIVADFLAKALATSSSVTK